VRLVAPGHHRVVPEASDALVAAGIEPHLVAGTEPSPIAQVFSALHSLVWLEPYVMYRRHYRTRVAAALRELAIQDPPDVLYFDHLDSFVYPDCAGAMTVGDLHNVYSTLLARTATDRTSWLPRLYLGREAQLLDAAERRAAGRAGLLLTVSGVDAAHFRQLGAANVAVVPNGVDCERYATLPVGRTSRPPVIMFLGAMSWAPNASAAEFLASEVLPYVRTRIPDVRLQIVGRDPSDRVKKLGADPAVDVTGAVPDVQPYLAAASLLAVPLSAGGGTRLKILEAFAAGLPVVSTPVGCEGIDAEHGTHLVVADLPRFGEAVTEALTDSHRLARLATEAKVLAKQRYDWDAIGRTASDAIVAAWRQRRSATAPTTTEQPLL